MQVIECFLLAIIGLVLLYLVIRIGSAAWFKSRREYVSSIYKHGKEKLKREQ